MGGERLDVFDEIHGEEGFRVGVKGIVFDEFLEVILQGFDVVIFGIFPGPALSDGGVIDALEGHEFLRARHCAIDAGEEGFAGREVAPGVEAKEVAVA